MQEIIYEKNWKNHPFLQKVSSRSDFDGWSNYFTVENPTPEDRDFAQKVSFEFNQNGAQWVASGIIDQMSFIDFVSFAWARPPAYEHHDSAVIRWRAVISGD
jgi:hypothetical protein